MINKLLTHCISKCGFLVNDYRNIAKSSNILKESRELNIYNKRQQPFIKVMALYEAYSVMNIICSWQHPKTTRSLQNHCTKKNANMRFTEMSQEYNNIVIKRY